MAEEAKTRGNELYKARKFNEAIVAYNEAIAANPNDLTYFNNKAAALLEQGSTEECIKCLSEALDRKQEIFSANKDGATYEKLSKAYCRLASAHLRLNQFDQAIFAYQKALTENNDKATRVLLREAENARTEFSKASYIDPALADEHREKGNTFFKAQKYAEAKSEYDEAIKRNPSDAKLYSNRAAALTKLAACPEALKDLEVCLKLDPTFVKAHSRKGAALLMMKELNKAMAAYDAGLAIDPTNQECINGRNMVMQRINSQSTEETADPEQVARAMQDPEIQQIMRDPQMQLILQSLQEDPAKAMGSLKDPKVANAIQKLMAAGILKMK
jgi:stress-induced-phosphoprotein 1